MDRKSVDLAGRIEGSGEAVLSPQESGALTTYMVYGVLSPRETGRRLRPGEGREETFLLVNGRVKLEWRGGNDIICEAGSAVFLPEGSDCWASNLSASTAIYVIAGGFTEPVHFFQQIQQAASQLKR